MSFYEKFKNLVENTDTSKETLTQSITGLLEKGADAAVLLFMAVEADNLPAVKCLTENGADPTLIVTDDKNAVSLAIGDEKWEIVEYLMTKDFNRSLLFEGIEQLSPLMIDFLESKYIKVPYELKSAEDLDWINQIN